MGITLHPSSQTKDQTPISLSTKGSCIWLSSSPQSYWEAVEVEGAGLFEASVWVVSSPFPLGLNYEPVPGLLGRPGGQEEAGDFSPVSVSLGRRQLNP